MIVTVPTAHSSSSILGFRSIISKTPPPLIHQSFFLPAKFSWSSTPLHFSLQNGTKLMASTSTSVANAEFSEEPATRVKFLKSVDLPGCSSSLSLLGTGYREKVFAIIGVKVYAAGLYVNPSLLNELISWKGKAKLEIEQDLALFQSIYLSSSEKSLQIALVRDVDGKTFWDALDEAISPRVKAPTPVDESALSTFRSIFQGLSLKKGTLILLTWLEPSKMLLSVSSNGIPTNVDATIESMNVTRALFDVFFGDSPVSPTLKSSLANGLATIL
ncbi:fatty-acid-binding protein 3, chloroplastic isoform X2 [Amaranthus tricolor]|uniref:fatty-acid-binding protein 3, chloroplastic isoform X2 n=1 Tax=Amaranthus tricolor TaxID=29722 RepID=UPI00258CEFF4|nr:fatty-acid-binding protein 3, chloroplastic isoform X2 [Amaranthus tricolor]